MISSSIMECILIYVKSFAIHAFWCYVIYHWNKSRLDLFHFRYFLITFWFFNIFNMSYTAYFGWNLEPATKLEQKLDNITIAGWFTSLLMFIRAWFPKKKKGVSVL